MKVIGSDYDGTIRINGEVKQDDLKAIKVFQSKGNKFGLVTGRSIESTKKEIKQNGFNFDFIVCNNGGVIFDGDLNLLELSLIDFKHALEIIEYIKSQNVDSYVLNDGLRRANKVLNEDYVDMHNSGKGSVSVEEIIKSKKIAQIVVGFNEQNTSEKLAKAINEKFGAFVEAYTNVNCVDIVPLGVSKANGFKKIIKHFNYNVDNCYGIGDSFNDMCLIKAYKGASLMHSPESVKNVSKYCVKDIGEFIKIVSNL